MVEYTTPLGLTEVSLEHQWINVETNIGNAVADSMLGAWDDTTIGIIHNGGIRSRKLRAATIMGWRL